MFFANEKGGKHCLPSPLPNLANGCEYYEFKVGESYPDPETGSTAGNRRLVIEVVIKAHQIRATYFIDHHYAKGSVVRIVD